VRVARVESSGSEVRVKKERRTRGGEGRVSYVMRKPRSWESEKGLGRMHDWLRSKF